MRLFVFGPDLSIPQPVWMSIFWPHYRAISQCFPTTFLPMPPRRTGKTRLQRALQLRKSRIELAPRLHADVRKTTDISGPKVLILYALNAQDLANIALLDPILDEFDIRILNLVDTLQPRPKLRDRISKFDLVLSFCAELARDFESNTGVRSIYFPPHSDALGYHSLRNTRPVDMILVGRRNAQSFAPIHRHYNAPGSDRLCLDFVTRTQTTPMAEEEFGHLMSMYSRSNLAFCYEASGVQRFRNRSPLTGRWMHAWMAGCTVVGSAPTSDEAALQFDWPEATFDLPEGAEDAVAFLEELLGDEAGLARRRKRNVLEVLRRHDTRKRFSDLLAEIDVPPPESLTNQLNLLSAAIDEVAAT